jgi:4-amino-4-deoxychorismate mutase
VTKPLDRADRLGALRSRLDGLDLAFLDSLRERLECCADIARVKRDFGIPMMQPHRIGLVQQRAANYGRANGIDPAFLHRLYDLIIEETCRLEDLVIGSPPTEPLAAIQGE